MDETAERIGVAVTKDGHVHLVLDLHSEQITVTLNPEQARSLVHTICVKLGELTEVKPNFGPEELA